MSAKRRGMAGWSFWGGDTLMREQYARVGPTATPLDDSASCDRCRAALAAGAPRFLWRRTGAGVFPPLALLCQGCDGECAAPPPSVTPGRKKR